MEAFGAQVAMTEIEGISLIGNRRNGVLVGLTSGAAALCRDVLAARAGFERLQLDEPQLADYLLSHGFCEGEAPETLESAYLHVTERCNLDCVGCYSRRSDAVRVAEPCAEDLKDAIAQLAACGLSTLNISGGEPFLRDDLVELARHAKRCGIARVRVATNGTLPERMRLDELASAVDEVIVSFDGYSADAPAHVRGVQRFDQLTRTVRAVAQAGVPVTVLPTLHAKNIEDIPRYLRLGDQLGVPVNFSLLTPSACNAALGDLGFGPAQWARFADVMCQLAQEQFDPANPARGLTAKSGCGAGVRCVSVDARGSVYPCHMLHDGRYCMGNLREAELAALLGPVDCHEAQPSGRERCAACDYELLCGGECAVMCPDEQSKRAYCDAMELYYSNRMQAIAKGVHHAV